VPQKANTVDARTTHFKKENHLPSLETDQSLSKKPTTSSSNITPPPHSTTLLF
jgi:hypothetical protein